MSLRIKIAAVFFSIIILSLAFLGSWSIKRAENNLDRSYFLYLDTMLDRYLAENVIRMHSLLEKNGLDQIESFVRDYQRRSIKAAENMDLAEVAGIMIIDRAGKLVFASPDAKLPRKLELLAPLASGLQNDPGQGIKGRLHIDRATGWLYEGRFFEPWGWSVLLTIDHSVIHKSEIEIRYATLGVAAMSLLISGLLILILLNRFLNRPITILKKAAEQVAQGKSVETIDIGTGDELGDLARSMEAMSTAIKDYREKQLQWQGRLERQVRDRTAELEEANNSLVEEILEREQTQHALEQSEKLFRDLVENLPFPVVVSTADPKNNYVNPRFEEVFGFGAEELPGREDWKGYLYPGRDRAAPGGRMEREGAPAAGEGAVFEGALTTKSGREVSVLSRVFRIGEAYYSVLEDITDRLKAEWERDRKNRLEGVMEMAGATCHELNQPLQVVVAHLDLLKMREGNDADLERRIEVVLEQLESIIDLIARIEGITRYEVKDYVGGMPIVDLDRASAGKRL